MRETDGGADASVAVVSDALARFAPDRFALGDTLSLFDQKVTIVGVVESLYSSELPPRPKMEVFVPYNQVPSAMVSVLLNAPVAYVRAKDVGTEVVLSSIRGALETSDRLVVMPISITPGNRIQEARLLPQRLASLVSAMFAALGTLLIWTSEDVPERERAAAAAI